MFEVGLYRVGSVLNVGALTPQRVLRVRWHFARQWWVLEAGVSWRVVALWQSRRAGQKYILECHVACGMVCGRGGQRAQAIWWG